MTAVTIAPDFRVLIPKDCRESLGLMPGQELEAISLEGRHVLIPAEPIQELRGFLAGMDTLVERDDDRI